MSPHHTGPQRSQERAEAVHETAEGAASGGLHARLDAQYIYCIETQVSLNTTGGRESVKRAISCTAASTSASSPFSSSANTPRGRGRAAEEGHVRTQGFNLTPLELSP